MIQVKGFHDSDTGTWTYLVFDRDTKDAVLIDPVLNYDPVACRILTTSLNSVFSTVHTEGLIVHYILETHAHADHLSAAQFFKDKVPSAAVVIGDAISTTQTTFKNLLSLDESFPTDGRQFDVLVNDGTCLAAGSLEIRVIATPGHTPTCCSYQIGDHVFVGDALFLPHSGTGRCDFPNGSAGDLYDSITQKLYSLPDHLCLYTCHDYPEPGIAPQMCATVAEHKKPTFT